MFTSTNKRKGPTPNCLKPRENELNSRNQRCHAVDENGLPMPGIFPQVEKTQEADGRVVYQYRSRFDPRKVVNQAVWVVTHINTEPNSQSGHAMIIVERFDNTTPIVDYAHLTVPQGFWRIFSRTATIHYNDFNHYHHLFQDSIDKETLKSYRRPKEQVMPMLRKLTELHEYPIPFHFAGNKSLLYSNSEEDHNCLTWSYQMLALANIKISDRPFFENVKATPARYFQHS